MRKATAKEYGNTSISQLKGADRVRKRPAVIFGSDGLEGCEHAVFEILSNAIDEAREGYGDIITVTRYSDKSIEVEDFDAVLSRAHALGAAIVYGPAAEPWGVRRFYLRDPAGTLVNIVTHTEA